MKKILVMFLLLMALCGVCSAENRWVIVDQSDDLTILLDTQRVRSYGTKSDPYIDCWLKWVDPKSVHIDHTFIRGTDRSYMVKEIIYYDESGKAINSYNNESNGWSNPVPDSVMEYTINNVLSWASKKGY